MPCVVGGDLTPAGTVALVAACLALGACARPGPSLTATRLAFEPLSTLPNAEQVVVAPDGLLVAVAKGALWFSADEGAHWSRVFESAAAQLCVGPGRRVVVASHSDSSAPITIAWTSNRRDWQRQALPLTRLSHLTCLDSGGLVAAGIDGELVVVDANRQARSLEIGHLNHSTGAEMTLVALDARTWLLGTDRLGGSRTSDAGATWQPLDISPVAQRALPTNATFEIISDFLVLPGGVTLAATHRGIQRSTDAGVTWEVVEPHLVLWFARLGHTAWAVDEDLGVFESSDAGLTWHRLEVAPSSSRVVPTSFVATPSGQLLVAARGDPLRVLRLGPR